MNDIEWKRQLKAYATKHRLRTTDNGDGITSLMCLQRIKGNPVIEGYIQPYDNDGFCVILAVDFSTRRKMNNYLNKLTEEGLKYQITQEGDDNCCIVFRKEEIWKYRKELKLCVKRTLSDETKAKMTSTLLRYQKQKKIDSSA